MKSKGTRSIAAGMICLALTLFVLPTPMFEVLSRRAEPRTTLLFVVGLVLLVGGLGLAAVGVRRRSRDLKTARTYDTQEPASRDGDRPVNPYELPKSYGAVPPLG